MALRPRRRRRRRPWALYLVLIVLTLVTVTVVRSARSDGPGRRLSQLAYVDQVRPLVERSTTQGGALAEIRSQWARLGRPGLTRGLERLQRECEAVLAELHTIEVHPSVSTAHSLLTSTMALRSRAAASLGRAVEQAMGGQVPPVTVDEVVAAGQDLAASDRTYQAFLESLPVEARASAMPPSRWLEDAANWSREEVTAFLASVRSGSSATPLHDLSLVTLSLKPAAVGSEGGMAVLPLVRSMNLDVVVANTGNAAERQVAVVAAFMGVAGEGEPVREVIDLQPGQRRALQLRGLRPLGPGPATLRVTVGPVAGEGAVHDNQRLLPVVVRG